jgi:hypothetical protein
MNRGGRDELLPSFSIRAGQNKIAGTVARSSDDNDEDKVKLRGKIE